MAARSTAVQEKEEEQEAALIEEYSGSAWRDPKTWFQIFVAISILFQAVYGVIAFVYTLTQTTSLSSYYYTTTYTGFMGIWLAVILLLLAFNFRRMMMFKAYIFSFLMWYIFTYTVIVVWLFHYRHHDGTNSAPAPLTVPFMTYLCANIFIVFASIFFVILGWGAMYLKVEGPSREQTIEGLPQPWDRTRVAFLVMIIIQFVFGMLEGLWGWLFVLDYNMGHLWVPLMFFSGYTLFGLVQFALFMWMNFNRKGREDKPAAMLANVFTGHWDELMYTELFLFMFWVINFGAWVNLWQTTGVQYTQFPQFTPANMPIEYWSVFANSVFNMIFLSMLPYYLVTAWCYSMDIVENDKLRSLARLGTGGFDWYAFGDTLKITVQEAEQTATEYEYKGKTGGPVIFLFIFFWLFVFYQIIAGGFILNELMQHTYLATHFYVWYILADVWLCVVFAVYAVYGIAIAVRGQTIEKLSETATSETVATVRNAITACNFGRPLLTLLFIVFITVFTYSEIYRRFHNGKNDIANTQDPLLQVNSIYNGSLLGFLGMLFSSVFFVAKDAFMGIGNSNFKLNPDSAAVQFSTLIPETSKRHRRNEPQTSMYERS